ncbi:hypothetical protein [Cupriavidus sp. D384]|uniref:hypothetical protein n=1 Tax=Cupriavidus sp. D384 TaxID=1538095 RepID=UPI0008319CC0|nr:hypothetical protein [Cupriavidus sp. D384]
MTASEVEAEAQRKEREAAAYKAAAEQRTKVNEQAAKEQEKARAVRAAERKKYPAECRDVSDQAFEAIKQKHVYIGMTEVEARCAWGKPERVNNTINARGRRSQWVYPGYRSYLYFRDGILETVQN